MKKPTISVVIPAFNEEKYIENCLASLKKQTFNDFEIIVVDNNCTDKTAEIAKSFGARVIKEKKQGMIPARERGFKEAKAEIIARTDADTVVTPRWLEVIYKTFTRHPDVVAITGSWRSPLKRVPDRLFQRYTYILSVKIGKLISNHIYLLGPNMAIRKSAWKKICVNTDDKQVHEDMDLSYHMAKEGKIMYLPQMEVIFSLRRITENPIKGLYRYLGEYPVKFVKTMYLNDPQFHKKVFERIKKGKF